MKAPSPWALARIFLVHATLVAAVAVLASCTGSPRTEVQQVVKAIPCPQTPPLVQCPDLPIVAEDSTIEQLEDAWIDAQPAHTACRAAVDAWYASWNSCQANADYASPAARSER